MSKIVYDLLLDVVAQLEQVKKQLEHTAELLKEARGRGE